MTPAATAKCRELLAAMSSATPEAASPAEPELRMLDAKTSMADSDESLVRVEGLELLTSDLSHNHCP